MSESENYVRAGGRILISGLVSTIVMSVTLLMVDVQTRARFSLFDALARLFGVPGRAGLGFLVFVLFGVVVWPIVFAAVEPYIPSRGDAAVAGMIFATILWLAFFLIGTTEIGILTLPFYVAVTLLTHLVYGFTLGLVYGWFPSVSDTPAIGQTIDGSEE